MPFFAFLIGLVTAPIAMRIIKPLLRGTVKTTVGVHLQAKKLAAGAAEDLQNLAAEAKAEMAVAKTGTPSVRSGTEPRVLGAEHKASVTEQPKVVVTEQPKVAVVEQPRIPLTKPKKGLDDF